VGPRGAGGVQRVSDGPGEFLETRDEVQAAAQSGAVEPLIHLRDLVLARRHAAGLDMRQSWTY
jgi:hypothetical protein